MKQSNFFSFLSIILVVAILASYTSSGLIASAASSGRTQRERADQGSTITAPSKKEAPTKDENKKTVGWLYLPDANIDNIILQYKANNDYYLTSDVNGNYDRNGSFFADYRLDFKNGEREALPPLTALYGHSFKDDPNSGMFSGVKNYRDPEFAKSHPYVYFSTLKDDLVFEVFAVFEAHVNLPYNHSQLTQKGYTSMLKDVLSSSLYNYSTSVRTSDRLIVLSTCAMNVQGHSNLSPYTTPYRFVVMGKLVPKADALKTTANFTINSSPTPPDTFINKAYER